MDTRDRYKEGVEKLLSDYARIPYAMTKPLVQGAVGRQLGSAVFNMPSFRCVKLAIREGSREFRLKRGL